MRQIKLFAVLAVLAFAAGAVLFSNSRIGAQEKEKTGGNAANRDRILEKIASYKQWQQLRKPDKKTDEPEIVINSTAMG